MSKLTQKISAIPHLFGKIIVFWCVGVGTAASAWSLHIVANTGHDTSAVLGVILAFFGGELMALCLNTIFKKERKPYDE